MKYIYSLLIFFLFGTSLFSQVNILELVPQSQRLVAKVKHIKEFYHIDYGDTIQTKPVLSNEYWFDNKGRLAKEIEYETSYKKGDTVRSDSYVYKDSLDYRRLSFIYPRYGEDSIQKYETIFKYKFDDDKRLVSYTMDDTFGEYYSYNNAGLVDTLFSKWYFNTMSVYHYREDNSLKNINKYNLNSDKELESSAAYDLEGREILYKRFTAGNSHTTKYRKSKYNANGELKMALRETVESWRFKNYYSYNQQGLLTSIKASIVYPRTVYVEDLEMESDTDVPDKKIKRKEKTNREEEKRVVVKSHFIYTYNSKNLPSRIDVNNDQVVLMPVDRTYIYEYF